MGPSQSLQGLLGAEVKGQLHGVRLRVGACPATAYQRLLLGVHVEYLRQNAGRCRYAQVSMMTEIIATRTLVMHR